MMHSISFYILEPGTNGILQQVSFHNLFFIRLYHFEIYSFQIYRCSHLFHCFIIFHYKTILQFLFYFFF